MARRDTRHDVELVDDDGPDTSVGPAPSRARRRRTPLLVGAGLVVTVGVTGVVAQAVVDGRARASVARLADQPFAVPLVTRPPEPLWEMSPHHSLGSGVHTAGGLLVDVVHGHEGPVVVQAVDALTGDPTWSTQLLDGAGRPAVPPGADPMPWSGYCQAAGGDEDHVVCLVSDAAGYVMTDGEEPPQTETTKRAVVLDASDGTVVSDLTDVAGQATSFAVVGDVVVLGVPGDGTHDVMAVGPDGAVVWRTSFPVGPLASERDPVWVDRSGDDVVVRTETDIHLLDAAGRTLRSERLEGRHPWFDDTHHLLVDRTPGTDSVTWFTDDGAVTVGGSPVHVAVDDGSMPDVLLTALGTTFTAWRQDGTELWSWRSAAEDWSALVVDGRVHVEASGVVVTLDADSGTELWRSDAVRHLPVPDGRHLLGVATAPGRGVRAELVALDPTDGSELWRSPLPDGTDEVTGMHRMLVAQDLDPVAGDRLTVLG